MIGWVVLGAILILLSLVAVMVGIVRVREDIQAQNEKIDKLTSLSLNPRTRIAQATMQSGAVTEEQKLQRLGRASVARRVVVGGDDDSVQKQNLQRATRHGPELEVSDG